MNLLKRKKKERFFFLCFPELLIRTSKPQPYDRIAVRLHPISDTIKDKTDMIGQKITIVQKMMSNFPFRILKISSDMEIKVKTTYYKYKFTMESIREILIMILKNYLNNAMSIIYNLHIPEENKSSYFKTSSFKSLRNFNRYFQRKLAKKDNKELTNGGNSKMEEAKQDAIKNQQDIIADFFYVSKPTIEDFLGNKITNSIFIREKKQNVRELVNMISYIKAVEAQNIAKSLKYKKKLSKNDSSDKEIKEYIKKFLIILRKDFENSALFFFDIIYEYFIANKSHQKPAFTFTGKALEKEADLAEKQRRFMLLIFSIVEKTIFTEIETGLTNIKENMNQEALNGMQEYLKKISITDILENINLNKMKRTIKLISFYFEGDFYGHIMNSRTVLHHWNRINEIKELSEEDKELLRRFFLFSLSPILSEEIKKHLTFLIYGNNYLEVDDLFAIEDQTEFLKRLIHMAKYSNDNLPPNLFAKMLPVKNIISDLQKYDIFGKNNEISILNEKTRVAAAQIIRKYEKQIKEYKSVAGNIKLLVPTEADQGKILTEADQEEINNKAQLPELIKKYEKPNKDNIKLLVPNKPDQREIHRITHANPIGNTWQQLSLFLSLAEDRLLKQKIKYFEDNILHKKTFLDFNIHTISVCLFFTTLAVVFFKEITIAVYSFPFLIISHDLLTKKITSDSQKKIINRNQIICHEEKEDTAINKQDDTERNDENKATNKTEFIINNEESNAG